FQDDTMVLREDRGNKLGLLIKVALIKVANMERLSEQFPDARSSTPERPGRRSRQPQVTRCFWSWREARVPVLLRKTPSTPVGGVSWVGRDLGPLSNHPSERQVLSTWACTPL
ncbi:MAG: hypothetical protein ABWX85_06555, partial [Arthrobacter sp.]